jgi:hypothetical protein
MPGNTNTRRGHGHHHAKEPDETAIAALGEEMAAYRQAHGYQPTTLSCGQRGDRTAPGPAGWTTAPDALNLLSSHGPLVPALAHPSTDDIVRNGLVRLVRRTGATVGVLHPEQPDETERAA